ncbi:MAG TPA: hypothetical protein VFK03_01230 [Candidatus Saccharimonadales bacterium]|nr:hypothetical protein [Candidatus Saccharimonadales bacterium]
MDKKTKPTNPQQLTDQLKSAVLPMVRHHAFIAAVVFLGFLVYAVFTVSQILLNDDKSMNAEAQKQAITTHFDQKTIDQIEQLKSRQQSTDLSLPDGHINPFK